MGSRDKHKPVSTAELYDRRMEANGNRCDTMVEGLRCDDGRHGVDRCLLDSGV
jgi:hypothetical protein